MSIWRLKWEDRDYACRDEHGSLLAVPPPQTRCSLGYCAACAWRPGEKGCLFVPSYEPVMMPRPDRRTEDQRQSEYMKAVARKRARGLGSNSKPLRCNCWNCLSVRCADGTGKFVCVHSPDDAPVTVYTMRNRRRVAEECDLFEWRLVMDIPILEEEVSDGG